MNFPDELRYTEQHEWVRADGTRLFIGITDFAQDALGDVVYVDIPEVGTEIKAGEPFGEVESTKSVSDVYAPVTGKVTTRNDALVDSPELVNQDPYGDGWMIEVEAADPNELERLLTAQAYREFTEKESPGQD